jgi:hypothetical protein
VLEYLKSFSALTKMVAPVLATFLSCFGLYKVFYENVPAIQPIATMFQAERGPLLKDLSITAVTPKVIMPQDLTAPTSIQMTTKAALVSWHDNVRNDCFLLSRSVTVVDMIGTSLDVENYAGSRKQLDLGIELSVIPFFVPSNLIPGRFAADITSTYSCKGLITSYKYPRAYVNVTF